jgi:hypothetical protein
MASDADTRQLVMTRAHLDDAQYVAQRTDEQLQVLWDAVHRGMADWAHTFPFLGPDVVVDEHGVAMEASTLSWPAAAPVGAAFAAVADHPTASWDVHSISSFQERVATLGPTLAQAAVEHRLLIHRLQQLVAFHSRQQQRSNNTFWQPASTLLPTLGSSSTMDRYNSASAYAGLALLPMRITRGTVTRVAFTVWLLAWRHRRQQDMTASYYARRLVLTRTWLRWRDAWHNARHRNHLNHMADSITEV